MQTKIECPKCGHDAGVQTAVYWFFPVFVCEYHDVPIIWATEWIDRLLPKLPHRPNMVYVYWKQSYWKAVLKYTLHRIKDVYHGNP